MIILTRLGGGVTVAVNPDLILRAEPTPDTVITLVDGHKLVVVESIEELVTLVREWRASVTAEAYLLTHAERPQLYGVESPGPSVEEIDEHAAIDSPRGRVLRLRHRED